MGAETDVDDDDDDAMKRIERAGGSSCRCMHARCIPSGRHTHMRTEQARLPAAAAMAVRAARETRICHHVNRWGSMYPWRWITEAWRGRERERGEAASSPGQHDADSEAKKETGFCFLPELPKRPASA